MAKRKKLTAPTAEDLGRIEDEFRRETRPGLTGAVPPIAQVAADAARDIEVMGPEARARLAEAEAAAETLKGAEEKGLILREIPLDDIRSDALFRDRMSLIREELDELKLSISQNGMRMPIEVFALDDPGEGGAPYGLISGFRRLMVVRELYELTGRAEFATIRAFVRQPRTSADRFAAIAEENEVRASLSHYERGRFAALTASNGVFANVEEAVDRLFPFASKAKRSKVRSFALIFEEIGDMLNHAEGLTEKQGLRLAAALRAGAERELREVLARAVSDTAREEWQAIEPVVTAFEEAARDPARGGRPATRTRRSPARTVETSTGIRISWGAGARSGYVIELDGEGLTTDLMTALVEEIRRQLGRSGDN